MKWIYTWSDGKRLVFEAENALQADDKVKAFLRSKGIDPNFIYQAKQTQEGTAKKVAEQENRALAGNIKAERQAVIDKEQQEEPLWKTLAKGVVRTFAPNQAESYEQTGEGSLLSSGLDAVNLMSLGSIPALAKGMIKPITSMAISGAETLGDIGQQEIVYGSVDPTRTALGGILAFAPETGKQLKQGLQSTAENVVANTVLPSKKSQKFKPLQYKQMLEERMFSGLGKYSGIEKLQARMQPFFDIMNKAKEGGATVDLEKAYKKTKADIVADDAIPALEKESILENLRKIYNAELQEAEKVIPEVRGVRPSKANEYAMKEFESRGKAKLTKATKEYEKQVENMRNSGMSEEQIAKIIGEAPIDPIKDVGLKQVKKPQLEDFFSFEDAKRQADEMFDPFEEYQISPRTISYDLPLDVAMKRKSGMQKIGYEQGTEAPKAKAYRAFSGGLLEGIEDSDPVVRQAMADVSPYLAMQKALEARKPIGGSNSVIPLKDWMAINAGGLQGYLLNKIPSTMFGAQMLYDAGRATPTLGNILGITRPQLSEMTDE